MQSNVVYIVLTPAGSDVFPVLSGEEKQLEVHLRSRAIKGNPAISLTDGKIVPH